MGRKPLIILGLVGTALALGLLVRPQSGTGAPSKLTQQTPATAVKEGVAVGDRAPDFALKDLGGNTVHLSDLRGKPVFINFWATWCPPCRSEMPEIQRLYQQHGSEFHMAAINLTSTEKPAGGIPDFLKQNGYSFPVLLDPDEEASSKYQILAVPTSYFLDANGIIRVVYRGPMDRTTMLSNLAKAKQGNP